jgi:hypothetical protein
MEQRAQATRMREGGKRSLPVSAVGPLLPFVCVRVSYEASARRGGRYPGWAHDGAVAAAQRLRCDARATRAAAVPLVTALNAPRLHGSSPVLPYRAGLPLASLRFSPPHKSPTPGTAHRAAPLMACVDENLGASGESVGGCAPAATYAAPRSAELMAERAQRALRLHTRRDCSSEANEVSVASFATGHEIEHHREPLAQRGAAASERRRIPACGFASLSGCKDQQAC